jgi:hypothetical protein
MKLRPVAGDWRIAALSSSWASYEAVQSITGERAFEAQWRAWDADAPPTITPDTMWLGARPVVRGTPCMPLLAAPADGAEVNCIWDGLEIEVVGGPLQAPDAAAWWKLASSNVQTGLGGWVSENQLEHIPRGSYSSGGAPWWDYLRPWEWPLP